MPDLSRTYSALVGPQRAPRFARVIAQLLCGWVCQAIARELRIRRDTRRLLEAEPRMLNDLGIVRADVERLVRHGRDDRSP